MGVDARVAMPWKMFGRGDNSAFLKPPHVGKGFICNRISVFPERAEVDDWVVGIIIHVDHRCIIDMHPHALALLGDLEAHFLDERVVALYRAERHLVGIANR